MSRPSSGESDRESTRERISFKLSTLDRLMDGTEPVEEELKKRIEDTTGQKVRDLRVEEWSRWLHFGNVWSPRQVVGVSVCWVFQEHEDELMELIESKLVEKEERLHPAPASDAGTDESESRILRSLSWEGVFGCCWMRWPSPR